MANQNDDQTPRPAFRESELLPVMMAVALAVAAQLALNDDLVLLGVAGYIVAAWLFISSVRGIFDAPPAQPAASESAAPDLEEASPEVHQPAAEVNRLDYLRRNWRLVTLAEIFRGDIPPDRLRSVEQATFEQTGPVGEPAVDAPLAVDEDLAPAVDEDLAPAAAARLESWAASDAPESSPRAVKVTPQGDVLVLDTGLAQVLRFDPAGRLLATYELAELAGVEVLDLAVSPDGRTLYIVDAASMGLLVVTLSEEEPAGEEE